MCLTFSPSSPHLSSSLDTLNIYTYTMTLYENEKTLHRDSVTHGFNSLAIRDEKPGLRTQEYDFTDQPPPYEAHFATPISTQPSSVLAQHSATGPSTATVQPCVVPRELISSNFQDYSTNNHQKYRNPSAVLLAALSREHTHLLSHHTTSLNQTSSLSSMD